MKAILTTLAGAFLSVAVMAQGPGHQRTHIAGHPRVNQVNSRIDNQEKRIDKKRADGQMTAAQAHKDRRELSEINQEKHDMRKTDNGHLTKADQQSLNQQLNSDSRNIHNQ